MEQAKRIHRDEATWREIFARQAASGLLVVGVLPAGEDQPWGISALAPGA